MMKYGFVYIWYDRKHKRYYVGAHWGSEDDGYVCSSKWMKRAYRLRPDDFKRRVLERIYTSKKDTFLAEEKWLLLMKPEELRVRYYNLTNHILGYWKFGIKNDWSKGKIISESQKQKNREAANLQFSDPANREAVRQQMLSKWADPEYKKMQQEAHKKPRPNRQGIPINIAGVTGVKFVTYDKKRDKYRVKIRGKYIGQYTFLQEAGKAVELYEKG